MSPCRAPFPTSHTDINTPRASQSHFPFTHLSLSPHLHRLTLPLSHSHIHTDRMFLFKLAIKACVWVGTAYMEHTRRQTCHKIESKQISLTKAVFRQERISCLLLLMGILLNISLCMLLCRPTVCSLI